jgi:hypothetical protein
VSTVKRFVYVVAPAGRRVHMVYKTRYQPVEGDKTACGQTLSTTWKVAGLGFLATKRRCLKCERANV